MHGNSLKNPNPHHLYEIEDTEEKTTFKYGISDDPIEADGLSKRLRNQVNFVNLVVGWVRFVGRILVKNITGRQQARQIEDQYIDEYIQKHGNRPRGNIRGGSKS